MPARKWLTAEDTVTARRALLDGLARDADIFELMSELAALATAGHDGGTGGDAQARLNGHVQARSAMAGDIYAGSSGTGNCGRGAGVRGQGAPARPGPVTRFAVAPGRGW